MPCWKLQSEVGQISLLPLYSSCLLYRPTKTAGNRTQSHYQEPPLPAWYVYLDRSITDIRKFFSRSKNWTSWSLHVLYALNISWKYKGQRFPAEETFILQQNRALVAQSWKPPWSRTSFLILKGKEKEDVENHETSSYLPTKKAASKVWH